LRVSGFFSENPTVFPGASLLKLIKEKRRDQPQHAFQEEKEKSIHSPLLPVEMALDIVGFECELSRHVVLASLKYSPGLSRLRGQ
jgi:hypothetical protein